MCKEKIAPPDIVVIGSGIVGSMCAKMLKEEGLEVHIYERYGDIRLVPRKECSMNLVMTGRGLRAAELCGIKQELIDMGIPVYGRGMHLQGETSTRFMSYGKGRECNYSVHRFQLNKVCMDLAEKAGVTFFFEHEILDISLGDQIKMVFTNGNVVVLPPNCPVISADGGSSRTRYILRDQGYTSFSETLLKERYSEMTFFPNADGDFCIYDGELHIWPRLDHLMLCLPNQDKTFTGNLCLDKDQWPQTREEARKFLEMYYHDAIPLCGGIEEMINQLMTERLGFMGTVRTEKWTVGGKVCLIGDAAHALVPFFGQGCNCGFEDCVALVTLIRKHAPKTFDDFSEVFDAYFAIRKENADAIADMSLENFEEMRRDTADPHWLMLKQIENKIEKHIPHLFRSRYVMVVYGDYDNVTYSAAKILGKVQWEIVEEIGKEATSAEDIDLGYAEKLVHERLVPLQKELGVDLSTIVHD